MNRRGQALVEFVLILPIFIFLIFAVYDFGMIFNKRNYLENTSTDIILLYKGGSTVDEINQLYSDINFIVANSGEYEKIVVSSNLKLITPGFNLIFGNPYKVEVERYIKYEQ